MGFILTSIPTCSETNSMGTPMKIKREKSLSFWAKNWDLEILAWSVIAESWANEASGQGRVDSPGSRKGIFEKSRWQWVTLIGDKGCNERKITDTPRGGVVVKFNSSPSHFTCDDTTAMRMLWWTRVTNREFMCYYFANYRHARTNTVRFNLQTIKKPQIRTIKFKSFVEIWNFNLVTTCVAISCPQPSELRQIFLAKSKALRGFFASKLCLEDVGSNFRTFLLQGTAFLRF